MEENLVGVLYDQLLNSDKPISILVPLCKSVFDNNFDNNIYGVVGRLVKLYGRESVFYSILDSANMTVENTKSLGGALAFFCKKRLEKVKNTSIDLSELANENKEAMS